MGCRVLKHRDSGWILDFRYLQTITVYNDFVSLCREQESFEPEGNRDSTEAADAGLRHKCRELSHIRSKSIYRRKGEYADMAENFTVRRLTIPELPVLAELFHYKNVDEMVQNTEKFIRNGWCDIFVLFREVSSPKEGCPEQEFSSGQELLGEVHVGYCSTDEAEALPGKRAYLFAYRIKKGHHNKGLGTFLLRRVLCELEAQGYEEFTIGVEDDNESAKHIYHKLGFREVISRRVGQDDEESAPYEYNLLLRRKPSCHDFIFVVGASGIGKTTLCRNLYGHYRTAYMEQSQAPEFETLTGRKKSRESRRRKPAGSGLSRR